MNLLHWTSAVLAMSLLGCSDPPTPAPQDASADVATDAGDDASADVATADADEDVPVVPVPFSQVQELFNRTCSMPACHGRGADGGGGSGGLFLTDGVTSYGAMVNQPSDQVGRLRLVSPGDPDHSYLVIKVEGTMRQFPECATSPGRNPCGVQMPQLAAPLTPAERTLIRNWIRSGAPMM
jgi:hypothetical protein